MRRSDETAGVGHRGPEIDQTNGYAIIECEICGFRHVMPLPTQDELDQLYKESFYANEKPRYIQEAEEDLTWWESLYNNYYSMFESHLPAGRRRLLEIGSGPGHFLKRGKSRGWEVLGFEPSQQASEYARTLGVDVINEPFGRESSADTGRFDVVYMNDVIEHVRDPAAILAQAIEVLAPGGILCVISPNEYNPLQKVLREDLGFKPWWLSPPQHLNYFDFASATRLLERLGMQVFDRTCTFPMEFFLLSGDNYIGNGALGRQCHGRRKKFEENMYRHSPEEYNALGRLLASRSIGREFVLLARRE